MGKDYSDLGELLMTSGVLAFFELILLSIFVDINGMSYIGALIVLTAFIASSIKIGAGIPK